jgi:hypothetical protein
MAEVTMVAAHHALTLKNEVDTPPTADELDDDKRQVLRTEMRLQVHDLRAYVLGAGVGEAGVSVTFSQKEFKVRRRRRRPHAPFPTARGRARHAATRRAFAFGLTATC